MANTYKNIIITPNINAVDGTDPTIAFRGANTSVNTEIALKVYPDSNGTLSFEGSVGQLQSITNDLTGTIFSVNDISGIPSIEVNASGIINLARIGGANVNVHIGNVAVNDGQSILQVRGAANIDYLRLQSYGNVVASNGAWLGLTPRIPVSGNSVSTISANGINFVNTATINVSVTSGTTGNANVAFTVRSGAQGVQGAPGTGAQGVQGAPGTGAQGVQGSQGAQGAPGTGAQGVQGAPGGGGSSTILTYTSIFGDGANLTYTFTHNLNANSFIPEVRRISSGVMVYPDVVIANANATNVVFTITPTTNEYRFSLLGF